MYTDRQTLKSEVEVIYKATKPVMIKLWPLSTFPMMSEEEPATTVYIQKDKHKCSNSLGTPVEPGTAITILMDTGETLWGITRQNALVGFAVYTQEETLQWRL